MVLLQHQQPVTDEEYARAMVAWEQAKKSFQGRASYLKSKKLDEATFMPGLGWNDVTTNPLREFLEKKPSRERLNQLRLHTQNFTGYSLYTFDLATNGPPPPELVSPAEYDAKHRGRAPGRSTRLFARIRNSGIPERYLVKVPRIMGEVGWNLDGHLINLDVIAYQESIFILYRAGVLPWIEKRVASGKSVTILEIGSGYGGFPYYFTEIVPASSYWACDLPESLSVSSMYLSVTRPALWKGIHPDCGDCSGAGIIGLPNYRFEEFAADGRKVDLAINMMSLSEMPEVQIEYYARKVSEMLGDEGVLFEQNFDNRPVGFTNAKDILPKYFRANTNLGQSANRGHGQLWANNVAILAEIAATKPPMPPTK